MCGKRSVRPRRKVKGFVERFGEKCWNRALYASVERSGVDKCPRQVQEKHVVEERCREVMEESVGDECCGEGCWRREL